VLWLVGVEVRMEALEVIRNRCEEGGQQCFLGDGCFIYDTSAATYVRSGRLKEILFGTLPSCLGLLTASTGHAWLVARFRSHLLPSVWRHCAHDVTFAFNRVPFTPFSPQCRESSHRNKILLFCVDLVPNKTQHAISGAVQSQHGNITTPPCLECLASRLFDQFFHSQGVNRA
jgi:hypothetical protein